MALINIEAEDSWLTELNALDRLAQDIQVLITERNSTTKTQDYNKKSAKIRIQLKQFENEITQLEKKLPQLVRNRSITEKERERRMRQVEVLASRKVSLDQQFSTAPASSSRSELLESASRSARLFDDDEPILETNASVDQLRQEQTQILREQDKGLENLSQVIARQKKLAMRIGTEIEDQNEIIDNIADQMDHTSNRVDSETRHVSRVTDQDSTWGYWVVIIGLAVAIIVVGIL